MGAYVNKILKTIQWHDDTGGMHGTLLSLTECYEIKAMVDQLRQANEKVCLECKQLDSIEAGREGYLQGLEFAATVADEMTKVPAGKWGKGAKYNAEKIAKICREEAGTDISLAAELKEERNRWYGKAVGRQIEINKLREALERIAEPVWWIQEDQKQATGSINGIDGAAALALANDPTYLKDIARKALAETI
jgi:hypothetical protein